MPIYLKSDEVPNKQHNQLYDLYIDESGDDGSWNLADVFYSNDKFFVIGGIIVDDFGKKRFEQIHDSIMAQYFSGITLPPNFKLHYEGLRNKLHPKFPYNLLDDTDKCEIIDKMFDAIRSTDCRLLSISLNIANHFANYTSHYATPANPRAYTLLLLMERFQYFLEDMGEKGEGIYERYNRHLRKRTESIQDALMKRRSFPKPANFKNVSRSVTSGDPTRDRVLQFTDFFVYTHYIKSLSRGKKADAWYSIRQKYYNLDHPNTFKRGNYDI